MSFESLGAARLVIVSATMPSSARATLDAAKYFLRQAAVSGVEALREFAYNINGSIVFGRSVTLHLQKQYAHVPGFDVWYANERTKRLSSDLCSFFNEARVDIIHLKGLKRAKKVTSVGLIAGILPMGFLVVEPSRAEPWYRRGPGLLLQDARRRARRPIDRLRLRLQLRIEALKARWAVGTTVVSESVHFDQPVWDKKPAFDLVKEYLDVLEEVVWGAEERFGIPPE